MTSPSDRPNRVLFLGTPDDPERWAELNSRLVALGFETTHSLDDDLGYAVVTEDILDGYCTADEALALQKLHSRAVPWVSNGAGVDRIVAAVTQADDDEGADSTISATLTPNAATGSAV